jgi:hypothetical protein
MAEGFIFEPRADTLFTLYDDYNTIRNVFTSKGAYRLRESSM